MLVHHMLMHNNYKIIIKHYKFTFWWLFSFNSNCLWIYFLTFIFTKDNRPRMEFPNSFEENIFINIFLKFSKLKTFMRLVKVGRLKMWFHSWTSNSWVKSALPSNICWSGPTFKIICVSAAGLAVGLGLGAIAEVAKQSLGGKRKGGKDTLSLIFSPPIL